MLVWESSRNFLSGEATSLEMYLWRSWLVLVHSCFSCLASCLFRVEQPSLRMFPLPQILSKCMEPNKRGVSLWNHEEEKSALHTVLPGILITVMRKVTITNEGLFLCVWPLRVRSQALWEGLALLLISSPGQYYFFSFIIFLIGYLLPCSFFLKKKILCVYVICVHFCLSVYGGNTGIPWHPCGGRRTMSHVSTPFLP